jgi:hypothetical protein
MFVKYLYQFERTKTEIVRAANNRLKQRGFTYGASLTNADSNTGEVRVSSVEERAAEIVAYAMSQAQQKAKEIFIFENFFQSF